MYWVGTRTAVEEAEAMVSAIIVGQPEYRNGIEVPPEERITTRWAIPEQTMGGMWVIPAYDGIDPDGVKLTDTVDWPDV